MISVLLVVPEGFKVAEAKLLWTFLTGSKRLRLVTGISSSSLERVVEMELLMNKDYYKGFVLMLHKYAAVILNRTLANVTFQNSL